MRNAYNHRETSPQVYQKRHKFELELMPLMCKKRNSYYRTTFLSAFPAVNPGVLRAGMLIGAPVCGLRPVRDFLDRTIKVPNPVTTTLSPFLSASVIAPKTAATDSLDALAVRFAFLATTSTRSALVILFHLLRGRRIGQE